MAATAKEQTPESDAGAVLDAEVEQCIAACGGDLRATIRALVIFGHIQETKLTDMQAAVSHGFPRGRFLTERPAP